MTQEDGYSSGVAQTEAEGRYHLGDDGEIGPVEMDLLWHSELYRYGENVHISGDGAYDVEGTVDPPTFRPHDEVNGDRYGESVTVLFLGFELGTGRP